MPKLIRISLILITIIALGYLLNSAMGDRFLEVFTEDSRIHSLDLEEYRTNPRPE